MSGKIDEVHKEMKAMEARFQKLEEDQQHHFQEALEKASAVILAEVKKTCERIMNEIAECNCNKEILDVLRNDPKGKQKEEPKSPVSKMKKTGWYPENLKLKINPFGGGPL